MSRVLQGGGFYVVGGPVQPDRACYVAREADDELAQCIAEQRFCYVLAPRASGKSSLMARTIKALRSEGQLAAVVDLSQLAVRDGTDAGRWYYSIAYRIVRELRLKADLQSWWQEKSALMSEQRLAEFFWEVVLANTTVPVTIFFDGIERALHLPFAQELYSAIRACYTRRATEPDYARLGFVVLGSAPHTQLCPDMSVSPFTEGQAIDLPDFTLDETYRLGAGLGLEREQARAAMAEIHSWTGGQPYLTQKVARGVARKGGAKDVERVVRELLLGPGVTREEPLLSHIRAMLTDGSSVSRQALMLLDKIARGVEVYDDRALPAHAWLHMTGVVAVGPGGRLHYRNRLYRVLFTSRWARAALPFNWKSATAAAAVIAALVVVPLWYTYYLPRPYMRTLTVVTQDIAVAEDAYQKLRRLPGFARAADDLLAEVMTRRARQATGFAEVRVAADAVRNLPEREQLAEELMSEFWLRRAGEEAHAERRDAALLYALRALPAGELQARAALVELIGEDYPRLERSYRLPAAPAHWDVDWDSGALTLIDRTHRAERLPLPQPGDGAGAHDTAGRVVQLTALQHVPLRREVSVEQAGTAGAFDLQLTVRHPGVSDLTVTLEAPSGAVAAVPLPRRGAELLDHTFSAASGSPLAALASEERQGVWRLTLVDGRSGNVGALMSWGLRFSGGVVAWDEPEQGIAIPDPSRTGQVQVALAVGGRVAAARSVRPGTVGALALWDLVSGRLSGDVATPAALTHLVFTPNGERLLTVAGDEVALWDAAAATPIARVATEGRLALPPALGVDGRYLALAERARDRAGLRMQLLHADSGVQVASGEGFTGATDWALGAQARYIAAVGPARVVRIIDPRRSATLRELRHERDVVRLIAGIDGDVLLTVDSAGDIRAWPTDASPPGGVQASGRRLGTTVDPQSVSLSADGSMLAFEAPQGHVVALEVDGHAEPYRFRIDRAGGQVGTRLSPGGRRLLTANGPLLRLWRLEPRTPLQSAVHPDLTALALDPQGRFAAFGFQGGHVRLRAASELDRPGEAPPAVDYIGHRGAVAVLALDAEHGLIASGGIDGAVRLWDMTTVAPQPHFMRHPEGPVHALALSSDALHLASAAEYSARIWRIRDGELEAEVPVNGTALAVEFSPDSALLAVGDSAGNVFIAPSFEAAPALSARAQGSVRALAFAPDGRVLASGDESGHIHLWDAASAEQVGEPYALPHPVSWLRFSAEGDSLVAQTDHWIHRLAVEAGGLRVVESRLPAAGSSSGIAFADPRGDRLRLLGGLAAGRPMLHELELDSPEGTLSAAPRLLDRDWQRVLGLGFGSTGEVLPLYR